VGVIRATMLLVLVALSAGCTAPPPARSVEERRRPAKVAACSADVVDVSGQTTHLDDLRISDSGKALEEPWRFFELRVPGSDKPRAFSFAKLAKMELVDEFGKWLRLRLTMRDGRVQVGRLPRRARLIGTSAFGEARIRLRRVKVVRFLPARPLAKAPQSAGLKPRPKPQGKSKPAPKASSQPSRRSP